MQYILIEYNEGKNVSQVNLNPSVFFVSLELLGVIF